MVGRGGTTFRGSYNASLGMSENFRPRPKIVNNEHSILSVQQKTSPPGVITVSCNLLSAHYLNDGPFSNDVVGQANFCYSLNAGDAPSCDTPIVSYSDDCDSLLFSHNLSL